jgi:pheromone receptor transcription factor
MSEPRKNARKDEQNKTHADLRNSGAGAPYQGGENFPNNISYNHWSPNDMNYTFDQQYGYYPHPSSHFQSNSIVPQPFIPEPMPMGTFDKTGGKSHGKKKIKLEYIPGKNKRSVTFSKRKKGIMKKGYELHVLTGTEILLLVASESGHVYTYATDKFKPIIVEHEDIIQKCLSSHETLDLKPEGSNARSPFKHYSGIYESSETEN